MEQKTADNEPEKVLFGLILGKIFGPLKKFPKIQALISEIELIIIKYSIIVELFLKTKIDKNEEKSISVKNINENKLCLYFIKDKIEYIMIKIKLNK